jgi:hypothetical protein
MRRQHKQALSIGQGPDDESHNQSDPPPPRDPFPEEGKLDEINRFFAGLAPPENRGLVSIEDAGLPPGWYGGGPKGFTARLYLGAYNHLDLDAFIRYLDRLVWTPHDLVEVIVRVEDDPGFRVIRVRPSAPAAAGEERGASRTATYGPRSTATAGPRPHPLVGAWQVAESRLDGFDASLVTFCSDGTAIAAGPGCATWHGEWREEESDGRITFLYRAAVPSDDGQSGAGGIGEPLFVDRNSVDLGVLTLRRIRPFGRPPGPGAVGYSTRPRDEDPS